MWIWASLALAQVIAHVLPWAQHKTAALTQSAHDLAAGVRFTPNAEIFRADLFYLPLVAASLVLAILAAQAGRFGTRWFALLLAGLAVAQFALPEYPKYFDLSYRTQLALCLVTVLFIFVIALMGGQWMTRSFGLRMAGFIAWCVMCATPLAGFWMVKPHIEVLYRDGLAVGTGWWLALAATLAGAAMLLPRPLKHKKHGNQMVSIKLR